MTSSRSSSWAGTTSKATAPKRYPLSQNYKKAYSYLYEASLSKDCYFAKALLGKMYLHGLGVEKNCTTAKEYFIGLHYS